jgi:hypothetical protein
MEVRELKDALAAFNPSGMVSVAIPSLGQPHEVRSIHLVGHLDHPGEVKNDPDHPGALDIVCDSWDAPTLGRPAPKIDALLKMIEPYPDGMHVRVAAPVVHDSMSHRMLDIVMIGHAVGTASGVQLVCENWDNPHQVIKEIPEMAAKRLAEAATAQEGA